MLTKINQSTTCLFLIAIVSIFTFFYTQPLAYEHYKIKFSLLSIAYIWTLLILSAFLVKKIELNKFDVLFFITVTVLFFTTYINYSNKTDLNIIENLIYGAIFYLPVRAVTNLNNYSDHLKRNIANVCIITIALILIKSLITAKNFNSIDGGTFNSTYFSNYISLFIPLLFYIKKNVSINKLTANTVITLILIIFFICLLNQARGSIFAISVFFILQLNVKSIGRKKKIVLLTFLSLIVCVVIYFLTISKVNSANGRLFIWKNSIELIKINPWGIGIGNFKQEYTLFQSKTLNLKDFKKEFLLADINDYAFNDPLQFIIEGGLLVSLFVPFCCYLVYRSKNRILLFYLIFILVLSSTSYILHSFHSLSIVILSFCIFTQKEKTVLTISNIAFAPTYLGLFWVVISIISCISLSENQLIQSIQKFYIQKDNKHLYNLGAEAFAKKKYEHSIKLLQQSGMDDYDIDTNILLAQSEEKLNNFEKAELYYKKANKILPRMFKPKYYLVEFYTATSNNNELLKVAKEIMDTPVKIPSHEITLLKNRALQLLDKKLITLN